MVQVFDIPLKIGTPQTFLVTFGGVDYRFTLQWRDAGDGWILDIGDSGNAPLICGIPLVTGANLLEQFSDIDLGGELWVVTDATPSAVPTFASIGDTSHLRFVIDGTYVGNYA